MCEISACLLLSVLLSSVQVSGLTQDIVPSQAVWEKLAVVSGGGKERVLFLQSCKSSTFGQCCICFYCLFLRRYCCNSTGCKQHLVCSKFTTGQVVHLGHLWDTRKGNTERAFQKLQLEMQLFPCCLGLQCQRDFYF